MRRARTRGIVPAYGTLAGPACWHCDRSTRPASPSASEAQAPTGSGWPGFCDATGTWVGWGIATSTFHETGENLLCPTGCRCRWPVGARHLRVGNSSRVSFCSFPLRMKLPTSPWQVVSLLVSHVPRLPYPAVARVRSWVGSHSGIAVAAGCSGGLRRLPACQGELRPGVHSNSALQGEIQDR